MTARAHRIERYGCALRAARLERGLSLRELAARLGVSFTYLAHIERGRRAPFSLKRTLLVAKQLRTPALLLLCPWVAHRLPELSPTAVAQLAVLIECDMVPGARKRTMALLKRSDEGDAS